jgi:hypothetical protein
MFRLSALLTDHLSRRFRRYRRFRQSVSRGNKTHLLELTKEPKQHFFRIDPLVKAKLPGFVRIRHDIVFKIENRLSERPGGGVLERVVEKTVLLNQRLPERFFVRHELHEWEVLRWCVLHFEKLRQLWPDILPTIEVPVSDVKGLSITSIVSSCPNNGFGQKLGIGHLHHRAVGSGRSRKAKGQSDFFTKGRVHGDDGGHIHRIPNRKTADARWSQS